MIFYCSNSENEEKIKVYGRNLIHKMKYKSYGNPKIYYKTDIQTFAGTMATGATNNHTYSLDVPRQVVGEEELPMQSFQYQLYCVSKENESIRPKGAWRIWFQNDIVDDAWVQAKQLYNRGHLQGILAIKVETGRKFGSSFKQMQFLMAYDGNLEDHEVIRKWGECIVQEMGDKISIRPEDGDDTLHYYKHGGKKPIFRCQITKSKSLIVVENKFVSGRKRKRTHCQGQDEYEVQ